MDYKNLKPLEALYLMQFEGKKITTSDWHDGCYLHYDNKERKFFNHHHIKGEQEIGSVLLTDKGALKFTKVKNPEYGFEYIGLNGQTIHIYEEPKGVMREKQLALVNRCLGQHLCRSGGCGLHPIHNEYKHSWIKDRATCPINVISTLQLIGKEHPEAVNEMYNRLLELEAEESEPSVEDMRKELEDFCDTYEHCEDCPLKDFMNSYTHFKYECKGYNVNALTDEAVKERYRKMVEVTK